MLQPKPYYKFPAEIGIGSFIATVRCRNSETNLFNLEFPSMHSTIICSLIFGLFGLKTQFWKQSLHGAFETERPSMVGKFGDIWFVVSCGQATWTVHGPGSRDLTEIFPQYVVYADILKQIFFVMASKEFFRLCISRVGTSKEVIVTDGLLELLAKGKHKLCTNCMNYHCVLFGTLLQTTWRLSTDRFFVLYVFF